LIAKVKEKTMANKKLWLGIAFLVVFFSGCTSTAPVFYSNNSQQEFTILGEVTYESGHKAGFQELLKAARAKYPNCDYVIDVMIDSKTSVFLWSTSHTYTMRGTAIQYKTR
jgi:hypothetical protein